MTLLISRGVNRPADQDGLFAFGVISARFVRNTGYIVVYVQSDLFCIIVDQFVVTSVHLLCIIVTLLFVSVCITVDQHACIKRAHLQHII